MEKRCEINRYIFTIPRCMIRGITVFLLVWAVNLPARASAQGRSLSLFFENADLETVMQEIKRQTQYDFVYNAQQIDFNDKLTLKLENVNLETALRQCFERWGLSYTIKDRIIILQKKKPGVDRDSSQQPVKGITGKVVDKRGEPLPGVSVIVKGSGVGVATDVDGKFKLNIYVKDMILEFSFIGMKTQSYQVRADGEQLRIVMQEDVANLDEVVVTGMEVIKKDRMTGSATVVTASELKAQGITNIDQILEGRIAGLNSTTVSGAPGTRAQITIRGENNLSGNTEPLWIVDGLPLMTGVPKNNTGDYAGTIMQDGVGNIMPEDIESISILKDASAAAIYGARAANGVIVVTTKKGFRSKTQFNYSGTYECGIAPSLDLEFMNSAEKLRYERSVMDNFGLDYARKAGRGGYLYRRWAEGYMTDKQYREEIERLKNINTDWFKTIFRTSHSHSHNLSLRGGSEVMTYYTSLNYQEKEGILLSNKYSNAGILMKLDYRPVKNLILALDVSANVRKNRDHASAIDPFNYAVFANPYERPYDENGEYAADLSYLAHNYTDETASGYRYENFNILRELRETRNSQDGLDASFTFNARYEVLPGLAAEAIIRKGVSYNTETVEVNAGTYTSYVGENFAPLIYKNRDVYPKEYDNGSLSESSGKNYNWSFRYQVDYSFDIHEDHLFSVLAASEIMSKRYNNFGYTSPIYNSDYRITGIPTFDAGVSYETVKSAVGDLFTTKDGQDRTVSFLGSLRYGYQDKYVVNFNCRADGADVIGDTKRFTPLWSVGVRYNLHKEKFFENEVVSEFALRGSYGFTGNIDRSAYPFSTITFGGTDAYKGNIYATGFTYPNPTVTWERKRDRNIGLDLGLWKDRIHLTADYYSNRTEDVLSELQVPRSTGRTSVVANGGTVQNDGIEIYLNVKWVNRPDFSFSTSANVSRNKNVIKKSLYDYQSFQDMIKKSGNINRGGKVNIVGKETGAIYGWKVAGVDPKTGYPQYYLTPEGQQVYSQFLDGWSTYTPAEQEAYLRDGVVTSFNEMPDKMVNRNEGWYKNDYYTTSLQYLGRSNPKYVGGFNTYLRYKNLEFATQWTFKTGHIIPLFNDLENAPNNGNDGYTSDLDVSSTNREKKYLYYWQGEGDVTDVRKFVTSGKDYWASVCRSDKYAKGDYLRMTNLSLSYRFPQEVIQRFGMSNMLLSFNARNLLTFTKYRGLDVGSGGAFAYPVAREFNFKLSVGF